jgi:hypothetical protein
LTVGSLLAAALTRAQNFLVEPVQVERGSAEVGTGSAMAGGAPLRPIAVVVLGMSAGCGVSTVAAGLALMLAAPGLRRAHLVAVGAMGDEHEQSIVRFADLPAAVVWDVPAREAERSDTVARAADSIVLVAPGRGRPAIAALVASLLEERFDRLLLVANRASESDRWSGHAALCLPESRLGAALVGRGHRPPGMFGARLADLAALVERDGAG